ncbi:MULTISPECIES: tryptophan-rich sensory protein [unclassified Kaistella]|uniref:tryptophan-rich sensory protein n=1 Tax=unclassified Kaistella TaxID=2762626 RepID=UPI002734DCAB|nr:MULTISPECIES: tryptophan-rich sensory protein [unclassified Kaistella]MDP2454608.1 tryptophan-rich sensory protein [Kaistella sp. SH11-4b]MDP2457345.1 tryptophan-rich sensory protein [Kaistella sp. SH40-3]MDP2460105.1 tryptophan-rich sensory protein [Kaistella sp. SH19-2b]
MIKKLQISNGLFLVFTIIFNYLSNTGIFNGKTIANVSNQYHNLFTPAGYAFSIWGFIYLLLIGFVFYTGRSLFNPSKNESDGFVEKIGWWFVVSCLANCAWILTWLYDFTGLSVIVLLIAFISLLIILMEELKYNSGNAQKWFVNFPFQIYAGWVSVALIAAVAAWLTKIEWSGLGISDVSWTIILIIIASLIHTFMTWKKNAPVFAFVAVWALVAIAMANKEVNQEIYLAALIAAIIIFISSCFKILKKKSL